MRDKFIYKIFYLMPFVSLMTSCNKSGTVRNEMNDMLISHICIEYDSLFMYELRWTWFYYSL